MKGKKRELSYSFLPKLKFFDEVDEGVYNFKAVNKNSFTYSNYLDNTIEISYLDVGQTGHMELRIGKKFYSVNGLLPNQPNVSIKNFDRFRPGSKGRVYRMDRNKLDQASEEISLYMKSIKESNFPPYDIYGALEEVAIVNGELKMVESKNQFPIKAEIATILGKKYLVNNSIKIPLIEKNGKMYIQTTNCTRVVTEILRNFLDFDIGTYSSAGSLEHAFTNNTVLKPYDVLINY